MGASAPPEPRPGFDNEVRIRLYDFLLQHRNMKVNGDAPMNFWRQFLSGERVYEMRIPSRGYVYELDPPLPVNVLKGTIKFVYEGHGERTFGPGDCVLQPAGIVHNELECTDDLEILEIYSPAVHPTVVVEKMPETAAAAR